jgi:hypothetical protein
MAHHLVAHTPLKQDNKHGATSCVSAHGPRQGVGQMEIHGGLDSTVQYSTEQYRTVQIDKKLPALDLPGLPRH